MDWAWTYLIYEVGEIDLKFGDAVAEQDIRALRYLLILFIKIISVCVF